MGGKMAEFVGMNLRGWSPEMVEENQIEAAAEYLMEVVRQGIQVSTPWARPSQFAREGWNNECTEAIKACRKAFRRSERSQNEEDRKMIYTSLRNRKGRMIRNALRKGHRTWIRKATEQGPRGLWKVSKWARNRQQDSSGLIPTLEADEVAESNAEKVELLRKTFFPLSPEADLADLNRRSFQRAELPFPDITEQEVLDAIRRAPPDKAPGEDGIPNRVWKLLADPCGHDTFVPAAARNFNACMRKGYNPQCVQQSITVTLRKGGSRDYRKPKSYRPVALINTFAKVLEAIMATRIAQSVEEHRLLPDTHLGGRKGISIDHVMQLLLDRIQRAWGMNRVASMVLLDVAGAYDNVSHERLLSNIKKLGLGQLAPWVASFLTNRSTRIKLPGYLSETFPTPTVIPQGSSISPILFLLFNAPLIRVCCKEERGDWRTEGFGWEDDAAIVAVSESYYTNVQLLQRALVKADRWARQHAAKFAPDKFELIHFRNPRKKDPEFNTATTIPL
jgi:hypothetical protein